MQSGKQRRAEIKAARLRRKIARAARIRAAVRAGNQPWFAAGDYVAVDESQLAFYNSYGAPDFVARGYYADRPFVCADCGAQNVWSAARQKWWYESAKGNVWSTAVRCRACRIKARLRCEQVRETHLQGLQHKQS